MLFGSALSDVEDTAARAASVLSEEEEVVSEERSGLEETGVLVSVVASVLVSTDAPVVPSLVVSVVVSVLPDKPESAWVVVLSEPVPVVLLVPVVSVLPLPSVLAEPPVASPVVESEVVG